ncbi:TPA: DUF3265 domain-containing protein [Vibrio vulnificus]|nr:DUF3265 domain-containing protein [Vibrio vulnificus]
MTRRSSGIHAAWHFWHAVSFGGEGGMRKFQNYESFRFSTFWFLFVNQSRVNLVSSKT